MFIIGIAGGTGSGKTTFVNKLMARLCEDPVSVIPQDAYYYDNSHIDPEARQKINFDHPNAIEFNLLTHHLTILKEGNPIYHPTYSFKTSTRGSETVEIPPCDVVIVEGILILSHEKLRNMMDLKIFIHTDADTRLIRVVKRDIEERGRDIDGVLQRYAKTVRPMHDEFVEPSKQFADIIVPHGGANEKALDLIARYINTQTNAAFSGPSK